MMKNGMMMVFAALAAFQAAAITATKEYVDRRDTEIRNNTYTKAETDARIAELAPPGITTNDVCNIVTNDDIALGLARLTDIAPSVSNTVTKSYVEDLGIESGVDAQTVTNMTSLTPVYSQTPTFSGWTCTPAMYNGHEVLVDVSQEDFEEDVYTIVLYTEEDGLITGGYDIDLDSDTSFTWVIGDVAYTATRTRTDIIGYTLGYQTNSVLAATNSLISAETATNIADTVSAAAIASADTTYRRTIGITNLNQTVQYVNITDTAPTTLEISMPVNGVTKDWIVYVSSVTNVTLSLPSATWWMADAAYTNDVPPDTPTALWFSQVTDGIFILGRQELTEVSAP